MNKCYETFKYGFQLIIYMQDLSAVFFASEYPYFLNDLKQSERNIHFF